MHSTNHHIPLIIAALLVAMTPHAMQLPLWIVGWCVLFWGYHLLSTRYKWSLPSKWLRQGLTLAGFIGVILTFGHTFGRDAGVGLLAVATGLKPLEIRSYRDKMVTLFMAYFLVVTCLLYSTSLPMTLYMFGSVWLTTAVLIHVNSLSGSIAGRFVYAVRLLGQAIPIMLILFFLFPRIQGSLWGVPKQTNARTGFNNELAPGDISTLVRSNKVAFRVQFKDAIPKTKHLYWRGLVLSEYDGHKWQRTSAARLWKRPVEGTQKLQYSIILEAHGQKWLFALDLPGSSPARSKLLTDYTVVSNYQLKQRIQYSLNSYLQYNTGPMQPQEELTRVLPDDINPQTIALAKQWRTTLQSATQVIQAGLDFIRNNEFYYTLNPPLLAERHSIDDFLFNTRKGYCEHYASAFAFLMRATGIPARIVMGYQGGEINPYGEYLIVKESDAHAWVEVWLRGQGWVRVDPTAAVAPARIEQGPEQALAAEDLPIILALPAMGPFAGIWKQVRLGWDALNNYWYRWVVGFTFQKQKKLLAEFGIDYRTLKGLALSGLLTIGLIAGWIAFYFWRQRVKYAHARDKVQTAYATFCRKMARVGLDRKPSQGPLDYARYVATVRNDLKDNVQRIMDLYIRLRYGRKADSHSADLNTFRLLVKQFNPKS